MEVITKIAIDLKRPSSSTMIYVVQGDCHSRYVEVSLYADGATWQIPAGVVVAMRYRKPDYTVGYYDTMPDGTKAWFAQSNMITMQLAPQMLTAVGTVTAQLEFILGNTVLGSFSFYISVEGNPAANVVTSEDYINWLQWIEGELDRYVNTLKESGEFHGGTLAGPVNMNGNRLYGLAEPVSDKDAAPLGLVKRAAPWNLLDNSDFRNPVNQRGYKKWLNAEGTDTSEIKYTASSIYCIDRWVKNSGLDLEVTDSGISLFTNTGTDKTFYQKIENPEKLLGKTLTFAVGTDKGIFATTTTLPTDFPDSWTSYGTRITEFGSINLQLSPPANQLFHALIIAESSVVLYWAALYEGEYTLETLPEYQPKGYGNELMECQRYFTRVNTTLPAGYTYFSMTSAQFFVPLNVPLRTVGTSTVPTIIVNTYGTIRGKGVSVTPTGLRTEAQWCTNTGIIVLISGDYSTIGAGEAVVSVGLLFDISADL